MIYKSSDVGYLSGLFDAKGTLKIENNSVLVWVTVDNFKVAEYLQKFKPRISKRSDGKYKVKWKDKQAGQILKIIKPHLILKKDMADIGIEFVEMKAKKADPGSYIPQLTLRLALIKKDFTT